MYQGLPCEGRAGFVVPASIQLSIRFVPIYVYKRFERLHRSNAWEQFHPTLLEEESRIKVLSPFDVPIHTHTSSPVAIHHKSKDRPPLTENFPKGTGLTVSLLIKSL
jgi:hypothetical protein